MIGWWAGEIKPGTIISELFSLWDFLPTFAELAGIESPEGIDGISFLPSLLGEEQKGHRYLYWEYPGKSGQQAVRVGKWKGIRMGTMKNPHTPVELYNLRDDPEESKNIADKHPQIIHWMERIMEMSRNPSRRFPLYKSPEPDR